MLVAIDVGNSAVKYGAFDGGRLVATERVESGPSAGVAAGVIPFPHLGAAEAVVVLSSSPAQLELLLGELGRPARVLGESVQRAVASTYADPTELGLDRIAAAYGARALLGGGAAIVVDAGTAITVDGIDAAGGIVPTAIAPGPAASRTGLRTAAPHLPLPDLARGPVRAPADGTSASLRNGFVLGACGAVTRLVAATRETLGAAPLVLTGGWADVLADHLDLQHRIEPHAVLHGVRALHGAFPA